MENGFIAYYRVSTQRQGQSGLGLEAQMAAVHGYCGSIGAGVIDDFTEIESGRKADRPMLREAIKACKKENATLLIAKLDRLARNVHFISGLLETGVRFLAVDMPQADRFMLHVYAAMGEEEARRIGERTRQALAAAKARGVELGKHGKTLARRNQEVADAFAMKVGPEISQLRSSRSLSFRRIAERLVERKVPSPRGGRWHESSVSRVYARFLNLSHLSPPSQLL